MLLSRIFRGYPVCLRSPCSFADFFSLSPIAQLAVCDCSCLFQAVQPKGIGWKKWAVGQTTIRAISSSCNCEAAATNDLENDLWHTHLITRTRRVDPGTRIQEHSAKSHGHAKDPTLGWQLRTICSQCLPLCGCGMSVFVSNIIGDINDIRHQCESYGWQFQFQGSPHHSHHRHHSHHAPVTPVTKPFSATASHQSSSVGSECVAAVKWVSY